MRIVVRLPIEALKARKSGVLPGQQAFDFSAPAPDHHVAPLGDPSSGGHLHQQVIQVGGAHPHTRRAWVADEPPPAAPHPPSAQPPPSPPAPAGVEGARLSSQQPDAWTESNPSPSEGRIDEMSSQHANAHNWHRAAADKHAGSQAAQHREIASLHHDAVMKLIGLTTKKQRQQAMRELAPIHAAIRSHPLAQRAEPHMFSAIHEAGQVWGAARGGR